jgi:hypothetical protein
MGLIGCPRAACESAVREVADGDSIRSSLDRQTLTNTTAQGIPDCVRRSQVHTRRKESPTFNITLKVLENTADERQVGGDGDLRVRERTFGIGTTFNRWSSRSRTGRNVKTKRESEKKKHGCTGEVTKLP